MAWPKGKPRSAPKKKEVQDESFKPKKALVNTTGDSLVCIHCRERINFDGSVPATDYEKHLGKSL